MKLRISDSTKNLLYCMIGIVLVVAAFFLGFQRFREENAALKQQRTVLKEEMDNLDEIQRNQEEYETKIAENQEQLRKYYEKFPALVQARDQILYASDLEKRYDSMFISNMNMGEAEYVTGTEGDAIALYRMQTEMECTINYDQLKDFLVKTAEDGTRKAVDEIMLTFDTETGLLAGQIHMNLYYMTGTQQTYEPKEIKDVNIGTQNLFQRGEVSFEGEEETGTEPENPAESAEAE